MNPEDKIKKLLKESKITTNSQTKNIILNDALEQMDILQNEKTISTEYDIWKFIRINKIAKLAAMVAIIIVTINSIYWLEISTPVYGIDEALEMWRNNQRIHIKGWEYLHTGDDRRLEKYPFEQWFDIQNGCYKCWMPWDWFGDYTSENPKYGLTVSDGKYVMETSYIENYDDNTIYPAVQFTKLSPFQQRLQVRTMEPFDAFEANPKKVKGFNKIGSEKIKNISADIWEGEIIAPDKTIPYIKIKIWMSPKTGEIIQTSAWTNTEEDSIRWLPLMDTDTIEYNVTPPSDCFSTEPPEGYRPINTKETAIENELGEESGIKFYDCIGFTLKDGSVICGWYANNKPENSQANLFKNLNPTGPLPILPAQIIELKPWPLKEDITLKGYHLTFTHKKGKFYEWAIYISDKKMPKRDTFKSYSNVLKYNGTVPRDFGGRPKFIGNDIDINSEAEFNTWVCGAMAELSDEGKTPDDITYDYVLKLAEQIRNSFK